MKHKRLEHGLVVVEKAEDNITVDYLQVWETHCIVLSIRLSWAQIYNHHEDIKIYQVTKKGHLSIHVKNVHQKSENVHCSECNKSIQKKYLKQHVKLFHSAEQTLYNCNVCTYQSKFQSDVNKHIRKVHQKL